MFVEKPVQEIRSEELPLACPPENTLWKGHPRVFLAFNHTSEVRCPYCGMRYRLIEKKTGDHTS